MALEYIGDSRPHREKMASKILGMDINQKTSEVPTSTDVPSTSNEAQPPAKRMKNSNNEENQIILSQSATESTDGAPIFKFSNCSVTINMNSSK